MPSARSSWWRRRAPRVRVTPGIGAAGSASGLAAAGRPEQRLTRVGGVTTSVFQATRRPDRAVTVVAMALAPAQVVAQVDGDQTRPAGTTRPWNSWGGSSPGWW